jgi:hypothetical protein
MQENVRRGEEVPPIEPGKSSWRKPQRTQKSTEKVGWRGCRTRREFIREMRPLLTRNRAEVTVFAFSAFFAVI